MDLSLPRGWKRNLSVLLGVMALGALTLALVSYATGPVGNAAGFEDDDGNLIIDSAGDSSPFDWNGFAPVTWTGTAPYRTAAKTASSWSFKGFEDAAVSSTDTGFAGGVKQDDNCGKQRAGKAPNKDDLKRIYLATKTIGTNVFLTLAWVRIPQNSTSASAHVGYEFNQSDEKCTGSELVERTGGDMLIVYDFEGGSAAPQLRLSRWLTTDWVADHAPGATCEVNNASAAAGCWGNTKNLTADGFAEGKVSTATVTDDLKPGGTDPGDQEFGEAGIDLTGAGVFEGCEEFGHAYAMGRTSGNSSQAAMTDIAGPGEFTVSRCGSVSVTKSGSDNGSQAGAVFTLYEGSDTSGDVVGTCTVQANGSCTPSFGGLEPGTYTIDETTVPTGYTKDASLPHTFALAAGEAKALSFTDVAQPGSVQISKADDAGDPVNGITFKIYSPAGISNGAPTGNEVGSCQTNGSGTCTISNVAPGTYTIDETVPASSGYLKDASFPKNITVTRGTATTVTATDPRAFKTIVIVCRQSDDKLYPSGITIDSDSRPSSLSAAQATAAGLSESALCGLTAGAKTGLRAAPHSSNPHDADISIPNSQP